MSRDRIILAVIGAALVALPFVYRDPYHLHILVLILIVRPSGLLGRTT